MDATKASRRRWGGCWLTLALAASAATVTAGEPPKQELHTLQGVVVNKADGKPLVGVTVAMAHNEKAYIFVNDDSGISSFGPDEKVLFFFPKRNGKTACETRTDEQGRFALKSFTSLSAKYSIVAGSREAGLAILENVCPKDHAETPLRIEIDQPAYLVVPQFPKPKDQLLSGYVNVALEPEAPKAGGAGDTAAAARGNIYLNVDVGASGENVSQRTSPLVGGKTYRVSYLVWGRHLGSSATLFETVVKAEPGRTVPVIVPREGGTTLSGRIVAKTGSPLGNVNVMLKAEGGTRLVLGALTDEKGRYAISHIPAGSHKLELLRYAVRVGPG